MHRAAKSHKAADSQQSAVQLDIANGKAIMAAIVNGERRSPILAIIVQRVITFKLSRGEIFTSVASDWPIPALPAGDIKAKAASKAIKLLVLPASAKLAASASKPPMTQGRFDVWSLKMLMNGSVTMPDKALMLKSSPICS